MPGAAAAAATATGLPSVPGVPGVLPLPLLPLPMLPGGLSLPGASRLKVPGVMAFVLFPGQDMIQ